MATVSRPKDRFKYNPAMDFSSKENRCEAGGGANTPFRGAMLVGQADWERAPVAEPLTLEPTHEAGRCREVT